MVDSESTVWVQFTWRTSCLSLEKYWWKIQERKLRSKVSITMHHVDIRRCRPINTWPEDTNLLRNRPPWNQHTLIYSLTCLKLNSFVTVTKERNIFRGEKFIWIMLKLFRNAQPSKTLRNKVNRNLRVYEYMHWEKTCCKLGSVNMLSMLPGIWQEGQIA